MLRLHSRQQGDRFGRAVHRHPAERQRVGHGGIDTAGRHPGFEVGHALTDVAERDARHAAVGARLHACRVELQHAVVAGHRLREASGLGGLVGSGLGLVGQ